MERFKINDKVVYKGKEHKVIGTKKTYPSKKVKYSLNDVEDFINDEELSPLFIEKKANKQAEFAKKLIATEK